MELQHTKLLTVKRIPHTGHFQHWEILEFLVLLALDVVPNPSYVTSSKQQTTATQATTKYHVMLRTSISTTTPRRPLPSTKTSSLRQPFDDLLISSDSSFSSSFTLNENLLSWSSEEVVLTGKLAAAHQSFVNIQIRQNHAHQFCNLEASF